MLKSRLFIITALLLMVSTKTVEAKKFNLFEAPKGTRFTISNGLLNVNGTSFNKPWKINPFLTAVGGKYSTKHLFHKVHTFDDLGVHVYEYQQKEEANEVQVSFVKQKMKFAPKNNFQGSFKLEKMLITRKTSIEKVMKGLPDYKFTKGSSTNSYRGEYKGVYIYLNYSDDKLIDFISFGMTGRS
jgi:hypothetical protein